MLSCINWFKKFKGGGVWKCLTTLRAILVTYLCNAKMEQVWIHNNFFESWRLLFHWVRLRLAAAIESYLLKHRSLLSIFLKQYFHFSSMRDIILLDYIGTKLKGYELLLILAMYLYNEFLYYSFLLNKSSQRIPVKYIKTWTLNKYNKLLNNS